LQYDNADKRYFLTKPYRQVNRKIFDLYERSRRVEEPSQAIRLDRLGDSLYVKESTGKNETKQVEP
jgi:hypothetical protein